MSTVSHSPLDGSVLGTVRDTTHEQMAAVVDRAAAAARDVGDAPPAQRQAWLEAIAGTLDANQDQLARLANSESALGLERLRSEVSRAAGQLRFYGRVAAEGGYLGVSIEEPTETAPRLVRINRALGPVAVFGASNFPLAFGVLGNDTGSALAAGCPVVAKAHPAHVLTCLRLAELATEALAQAGAPVGTFGMVAGLQAGIDLVKADEITAVGFTGSQAGGLALWAIANDRERVIPVYAEMGTVNPVVLTPAGAAALRVVAEGFVGSFTLGAGQFCSKPGLLFAPSGHRAADAVADALRATALDPKMLTEPIAANVGLGIDAMVAAGATVVARITGSQSGWAADAAVLSAPVDALAHGSRLLEETFGPVALVVEYSDRAELDAALRRMQGSLAGSVFGGGPEDLDATHAVEVLADQVGRVTIGDWPTGVAFSWAQQHGGPWPATSNPSTTSVGAAALDRFVRPVTFQSVPDGSLPPAVRPAVAPENPWCISRRLDGKLRTP